VWLCLPVSETTFENQEAGAVERVIHSEVFREELQEMVAKQISDSLQSASQPLYDLISLRQRYGQPSEDRTYGMLMPSFIEQSYYGFHFYASRHPTVSVFMDSPSASFFHSSVHPDRSCYHNIS